MSRRSRAIWEPKSDKPAVGGIVRPPTRTEACAACGEVRLACNLRHARDARTGERIKVCRRCVL